MEQIRIISEKYKLTYFNIRGRAEQIRLMFAVAQVPFQDLRIDATEWPSFKSSTSWGQLPMLEVIMEEEDGNHSDPSNIKITQTMAIIRFLAKKFGFYSNDHYQAAHIDEVGYVVGELLDEWYKYEFESSDDQKKAVQKEALVTTHFPNYFEKLSRCHLKYGGPYLLGEKLTFPDVMLAQLLGSVEEEFDGGDGVIDQYPVMRTLKDAIWTIPSVKTYAGQRL